MRAVLDDKSQDLAALRKENSELKRKLGVAERLILLLRELPEGKAKALLEAPTEEQPETSRPAGGKKTPRRTDAPRHDRTAEGDRGRPQAG